MNNNIYTKTIYKSDSIDINSDNGIYKIIAKHDIKYGEMLLIELVFVGDINTCVLLIRENEFMYNQLYPRLTKWNETNDREDASIKFEKNSFTKNSDKFVIASDLSKINHSCDPNCITFYCSKLVVNGLDMRYLALYSIKNISHGEEIKIMYGDTHGHREEYDNIQKIIIEYEKTYESRKIMMHHYLAMNGFFFSNNERVCMTNRFVDFVNKKYDHGTIQEKKDKMLVYVEQIFTLR